MSPHPAKWCHPLARRAVSNNVLSFPRRVDQGYVKYSDFSRKRRDLSPRNTAFVFGLGLLCGTLTWSLPQLRRQRAHADQHEDDTLGQIERSVAPLNNQRLPDYDLSPRNLLEAKQEFVALLGQDGVNENMGELQAHSNTKWSEAPRGELDHPSIIVYPSTTEHVAAIAKICYRRRIPMIPFSGGTSLEATLAACHREVCVDFKRMNAVLKVRPDDMDVTVQPAVGFEELNEQLEPLGLFFPPDPGPGAQIGGMIGQGCSGTNAYRYGTMKDWVLGLTVVLADGTIIKTRARPRKSSAGFDLTRLFVGAEGTLGFVTEAHLRLTDAPKNMRIAASSFPSIRDATKTAVDIVRSGAPLAAMELLDDVTMRAVNVGGYTDREWPEKTTIFFKFAGRTMQQVEETIELAQKASRQNNCLTFEFSETDDEATALWQARKTALWSLLMIKNDPDDEFISADICVPISNLANILEFTKQKIDESGLVGSCLGHLGDGNFHATVLYPKAEKSKAVAIIRAAQERGVQLDGTVTGEHGIGLLNRDALVCELGEASVDAMRQIKLALDPRRLLNPGKMFRLWDEDDEDASRSE